MIFLKQSTSATIAFGPMVANTDGVTLVTTLVGTGSNQFENTSTGIQLSKSDGTSMAVRHATAGASTYLAYGMYSVVLDTTDTNTLGRMRVSFSSATTVCPVFVDCMVMPANMYNSMFSTGGSIPDAVAGASGGVLISGSNAGTTTLGALTVTGTTTHTGTTVYTGNVSYADGLTVSAPSTGNRAGITVTGNGTGAGVSITGGNGATGNAVDMIAAATNSKGLNISGLGTGAGMTVTGGATGVGFNVIGGGTSGDGIKVTTSLGHGMNLAPAGSNSHGLLITGGNAGTSDGIKAVAGTGGVDIRGNITGTLTTVTTVTTANNCDVVKWNGTSVSTPATAGIPEVNIKNINNVSASGVNTVSAKMGTTSAILFDGVGNVKADAEAWLATTIVTPAVAGTPDVNMKSGSANAITATVIADAAIDLATFAADVPSLAMRTGTAQAGAATTITLDSGASASNNFYNNTLIYITGGTGIGQSRFISAYVGSTKVATVATWVTNPDNTSTFAILPFDAVAGATAPTVAQIVTGLTTDTTAGNYTVANSFGKSIMNGVALGTGLTVNALTTNNDKTGYALTSAYDPAKTAAQAGDAMALTSGERNSTADALLDRSNAIETSITPRGALRLATAMAAGKTNGMDVAGTAHIRDVADGKNRVTATTDGAGNRTATSVDVT